MLSVDVLLFLLIQDLEYVHGSYFKGPYVWNKLKLASCLNGGEHYRIDSGENLEHVHVVFLYEDGANEEDEGEDAGDGHL